MESDKDEYSKEQIDKAKELFANKAEFVLGVADLEQLPPPNLPEAAFAGRSNVGKSSIINAVTGQKNLAKTSNTPGRTQQLNFFGLGDRAYLVDLPGYGYAKAPQAQVRQWQKVIFAYLQGRVTLKRVFLLIDARHGIKKTDQDVMDMLDGAAVTYQLVLTKTDKVSGAELNKVLAQADNEIKKHPAAYIKVLATSSEKGWGIGDLQAEIASLV